MENLKSKEELFELIETKRILIALFGSVGCYPCIAIRNKLSLWLESHPNAFAVYLPIENFEALTAELGVFSSPTIFAYTDGKLSIRESGYFSLDEIICRLERYESLMLG